MLNKIFLYIIYQTIIFISTKYTFGICIVNIIGGNKDFLKLVYQES